MGRGHSGSEGAWDSVRKGAPNLSQIQDSPTMPELGGTFSSTLMDALCPFWKTNSGRIR